jgi:hypothetical protein
MAKHPLTAGYTNKQRYFHHFHIRRPRIAPGMAGAPR